jgi:hypothetical protein
MSKERKDGRYLNCYITRTLLEEFETVCAIQGRTKTSVLEQAMQTAIDPFYSKGTTGCDKPTLKPTAGIYKMSNPNKPGKIKKVPCIVLDHIVIFGVPYVKIWANKELISVPAEIVEEIPDDDDDWE